jgi:hypothetical protein
LGKNLWGPIFILKRQLIDFDWVGSHEPPLRITRHSHKFANMKVVFDATGIPNTLDETAIRDG